MVSVAGGRVGRRIGLLLMLSAVLLSGCARLHGAWPWQWRWPGAASSAASVDALRRGGPVSWQAEVSCPGCSERWLTLTLFPDGFFRLRERYLAPGGGRGEDFHDLGRWSLADGDASRLMLRGGSEQPRQFRLNPDGSLRMLDSAGHELVSIREYLLPRLPRPDMISDAMRLLGFYVADGGAGLFTECLTGQVWPLAKNAVGAELAARHATLAARPGVAPPLVAVVGRFQGSTPWSNQPGQLEVVQLDRFWPGEQCHRGPFAPAQPLQATAWQLIELDGERLPHHALDPMAMRPQLRLRADGRLLLQTGCNRVSGSYLRAGDQISFPRLVTTRMSCAPMIMQREQTLLASLRVVRQWRMVGNQLELSDGERVRARWLALDMP